MKKQISLLCSALLLALCFTSCESTTEAVKTPITISGGNDILVTGNKAIVLASGSNALYVVDLSSISANDRALLVVNEGNFGKPNSTMDLVLFHKNGTKTDTIVERNFLPGSSSHLIATIAMGLDAPNKMSLIGANRLLVTRRNATSAAIVDLSTYKIVDSVKIGEPSVAVAVLNDAAYITSSAKSYAGPFHINKYVISKNQIESKYEIAGSPEQAVTDSMYNEVIIAATGDFAKYPATFYFDGLNRDSAVVGTANDDIEILTGETRFAISGKSVVPVLASGIGASIISGSTPYYKGHYDAASNTMVLGVSDFTGATGKIELRDAATGKLGTTITTGIAPAHFAFYH
jgi:hypothetical protein